MAFQIGEQAGPARRTTTAAKLAPWLRRVIIGGALVWICCSMQNFYEDTRTHTMKVVYPLLLSREKITRLEPGFDPQKAVWRPAETGFPVHDGTVLFAKVGNSVFVIKIDRQTAQPEQMAYEFFRVGSTDPATRGVAETLPGGIPLPGAKIGWSGRKDGSGFLYLDDAFIDDKPSRYSIGVPFQSGDLEQFRQAIPAGTHFESVPWKIIPTSPPETVPAP